MTTASDAASELHVVQGCTSQKKRRGRTIRRWCIVGLALLTATALLLVQQTARWQIAPAGAATDAVSSSLGSPPGDLPNVFVQTAGIAALPIIIDEPRQDEPEREPADAVDETATPPPSSEPPEAQDSLPSSSGIYEPTLDLSITSGLPDAVAQWYPLIADRWPANEIRNALCVIQGESVGWADAHNTASTEADGGSVGLFQIALDNVSGKYRVSGLEDEPRRNRADALAVLLDPHENVRLAAAMWRAEGWLPAWKAQRSRCDLEA